MIPEPTVKVWMGEGEGIVLATVSYTHLDVYKRQYAEISGGYLSAQEIMLMLSVLQIVDNPRQDLPLVAVLRSNMVGLSSSELARIRIHMPKGDFYDALCLVGEKDEGELGGKTRQFLTHLQFWRNYARQHTLSDLIRLIYRQTGYYTYVGALPGGAQRQANLRALQDRARQFEKTTLRGLFNFLRFLEQLEEMCIRDRKKKL